MLSTEPFCDADVEEIEVNDDCVTATVGEEMSG